MAVSILPVIEHHCYWILATVQLLFISALLAAIAQSTTHRHPVTLAFLLVSWLTSWIVLLPFLAGVWDVARALPLDRSNVEPGTTQFRSCQANAMILTYLWIVSSGLVSVFSGEVFRIMLGCSSVVLKKNEKIKTRKSRKSIEFVCCGNPELFLKSSSNQSPPDRLRQMMFDLRDSILESSQNRGTFWQFFLVIVPFMSALPALILTGQRFSESGWSEVHADYFTCHAIGEDLNRFNVILLMWHLVPSCILSFMSLATYLFYCRRALADVDSGLYVTLTLRLGGLSLLSGVGAAVCTISLLGPIKITGDIDQHYRWALPLYMALYPLLSSLFFVESCILKIWRSWFQFEKLKRGSNPKVTSSDTKDPSKKPVWISYPVLNTLDSSSRLTQKKSFNDASFADHTLTSYRSRQLSSASEQALPAIPPRTFARAPTYRPEPEILASKSARSSTYDRLSYYLGFALPTPSRLERSCDRV